MERALVRFSMVSCFMSDEKRILDLVRLILCPRASLKDYRIVEIVLQYLMFDFANKVRSSAKNWWDIIGPNLLILMGSHFFPYTALSISLDSLSMHMMNMYGEMGSPCLIPLEGLKVIDLPPFTRIVMEEELM